MKIKNLIIILLSVIILGMGCWIGYKYYQVNYLFNNINERLYSTKFNSYIINRELNSEDWPITQKSFNGNTKLYVAEETSEDGKTQTLKIKIENLSNHELSGLIIAEFIKSESENKRQKFVGDSFSLTSEEGSYDEFEYTVDVSDLTASQKEETHFMVTICESGCMFGGI